MPNPYASALTVNPQQEQAELVKLKSDPAKMQELGLSPGEDLTQLKNDPVKYNRVVTYVKNQTYKSPAYKALEEGTTRPEFVDAQNPQYQQNSYEYRQQIDPKLRQQFGVDEAKTRYNDLEAGSYAAPAEISAMVKKQGGYDIEGLKDAYVQNQNEYANAYRAFVAGQLPADQYAAIVSKLSTTQRSLEKAQSGLKEETERGLGNYNSMLARSKSTYEDAYKRFNDALESETAGYGEGRKEKIQAAQDMYDSAKSILDESRKETDKYNEAYGRIYNPNTGKYEALPVKKTGGGGGGTKKVNESELAQQMSQALNSVQGSDGRVAPKDWNYLREAWVSNGGKAESFDANFGGRINPTHTQDYYTQKAPSYYYPKNEG